MSHPYEDTEFAAANNPEQQNVTLYDKPELHWLIRHRKKIGVGLGIVSLVGASFWTVAKIKELNHREHLIKLEGTLEGFGLKGAKVYDGDNGLEVQIDCDPNSDNLTVKHPEFSLHFNDNGIASLDEPELHDTKGRKLTTGTPLLVPLDGASAVATFMQSNEFAEWCNTRKTEIVSAGNTAPLPTTTSIG